MGIKVPRMAADSQLVSKKVDRLRDLKTEKYEPIEKVLKGYFK
jgi:hypothetical protein